MTWTPPPCGCEATDEYTEACTQVYPEEGATVHIVEEYLTRWVGEDTEYTLQAGAEVVVCGVWLECHDVHVKTTDGAEVWVDPTNIEEVRAA